MAEKEYIERKAAVSELNRIEKLYQNTYMSNVRAEMASYCCQVIKHIPAADVVEVKHGRWVLSDNAMSMWNVWVCSECGYRRKEGWMHTEDGKKPTAQYCENCMAKMDGGANDGKA